MPNNHRFRWMLVASAAIAIAPEIAPEIAFADVAKPKSFGDAVPFAPETTLKPLLDARLRLETIDQPVKTLTADAVTLRARLGFEIVNQPSHLALLVEGEGNLALATGYNAFSFAQTASNQYRPSRAVVADPQNVGLNRLQIAYRTKPLTVTLGRQRINLDDERWVGSVGWRQNEQVFDAVRVQTVYDGLSFDTTYADSQRSVFGNDAGPRIAYRGRFWLLGAALKTGPVTTKAFAYLLDYDPTSFNFQTNSSQTYGIRSSGSLPMGSGVSLSFVGSFAEQSSYTDNPIRYAANYVLVEGGLAGHGLSVKGGYEVLGADASATKGGVATSFAVQTPMATFHKWDGWADQFLTTPAKGLVREYVTASYKFDSVKAVPGLNAQLTYHNFASDIGNVFYGFEWDEAVGWRTGKITWLLKHAGYAGRGAGTSTSKFWLQAEYGF